MSVMQSGELKLLAFSHCYRQQQGEGRKEKMVTIKFHSAKHAATFALIKY